MALPTTNISISQIKAEIGSSSYGVGALVGAVGLNKWSFYAPGQLAVDGNKNTTLTPPTTAFKMGDFRGYDHSSETPSGNPATSFNWGPGGATVTFTIIAQPKEMNNWSYTNPALYITTKFYNSSSDRDSEGNAIPSTDTRLLTYTTITALVGHTRNATQRAESPQILLNLSLSTIGWPATKLIYAESYLSDIAGNRYTNLGADRNGGYFTLTFNELVLSTLSGAKLTPTSTGYAVRYRDDNTGGCAGAETTNLINGTQTIVGYVTPFNESTGSRMTTTGSVNIVLTKNGIDYATVYTGQVTGTYVYVSQASVPVGYGEMWRFDIRLTSGTWTEVAC